jgi:ATP-dependent Clp protease adaptor protein ClpS
LPSASSPAVEETEKTDSGEESPWRVILFNCECHSFDQVEVQLIKAIRCTIARARAIAWEVHTKGLCVVYEGPLERCEAVAEVLGSIGLLVKVAH